MGGEVVGNFLWQKQKKAPREGGAFYLMNYEWVNQSLGNTPARVILRMVREQLYATALKKSNGHHGKAAKMLGIHRNSLDHWVVLGRKEVTYVRNNARRKNGNCVKNVANGSPVLLPGV